MIGQKSSNVSDNLASAASHATRLGNWVVNSYHFVKSFCNSFCCELLYQVSLMWQFILLQFLTTSSTLSSKLFSSFKSYHFIYSYPCYLHHPHSHYLFYSPSHWPMLVMSCQCTSCHTECNFSFASNMLQMTNYCKLVQSIVINAVTLKSLQVVNGR